MTSSAAHVADGLDVDRAVDSLVDALLRRRTAIDHWEGRLASSACALARTGGGFARSCTCLARTSGALARPARARRPSSGCRRAARCAARTLTFHHRLFAAACALDTAEIQVV